METKKLQSKINLLRAQIEQIHFAGLFTTEEIFRLTDPLESELSKVTEDLNKINSNLIAS